MTGVDNLFSQVTRTTVANGNWLYPTTWDCTCYPMPTDNIVVNHTVTLDTSWYSTASITVNSAGTITEGSSLRQWAVYSGNFTNHGFVNISRFSVTGGTFTNNDSLRINLAFYAASNFINNGRIFDVDSFSNNGIFKNNAAAIINCTLYSNLDSIINDGAITAFAHTNFAKSYNSGQLNFNDFTNTGILVNSGTINFNNFTNLSTGTVQNNSLFNGTLDYLNIGKFTVSNSATLRVANNFANADSAGSFAHFINNGYVEVGTHWYNSDSVSGTGKFCIGDSTINSGIMSGSFDFCDNTPPASSPYIDWNSGSIGPGITYCLQPCNSGTSEIPTPKVILYPNPTTGNFEVRISNPVSSDVSLKVSDMLGKVVYSVQNPNFEMPLSLILHEGFYFVQLTSDKFLFSEKIIITK